MKKTEYRIDIAMCLIVPIIISSGIIKVVPRLFISNYVHYWIRLCVILTACLFECIYLEEFRNKESKDRGIISSLFISTSVAIINILSCVNKFELSNENYVKDGLVIGGCIISSIGIIVRYKAKKDLKSFFSHTVQIIDNHKLIKDGIYQYIRHPAYLGTFLIFVGLFFLYYSVLFIPIIIIGVFLGEKRVNDEEKLLLTYFGDEYIDYSKNVGRFVPILKRRKNE